MYQIILNSTTRSMSRLVTCLGLQHPQGLDFLNSNTCFYSRLYGIFWKKGGILFKGGNYSLGDSIKEIRTCFPHLYPLNRKRIYRLFFQYVHTYSLPSLNQIDKALNQHYGQPQYYCGSKTLKAKLFALLISCVNIVSIQRSIPILLLLFLSY